jgi:hypothetical protein
MYKVPAQFACLERSSQSILYTGWLMTCGHYCRMWYSWSLWSKKLISIFVLFWMVMELWWIFNCCKCPPVNCTPQVTLRPSTGRNRNYQQKLQLTTYTVHNWAAAWAAAVSGIFENLLKKQVCVNWRQFHEVKWNLYFTFMRYIYYFVSCISRILTLYSKFQAAITP